MTVVATYHSSCPIQHRRKHTSLHASRRQQEILVFQSLRYHSLLKPSIQRLCQFAILISHQPSLLSAAVANSSHSQLRSLSLRKHIRHDVCLAIFQAAHHLGSILAHIHSQRHSQLLGKLFCQQILHTHSLAMIFIVRVRTCHCQHYQLTIRLYVAQRECVIIIRNAVAPHHGSPWCGFHFRLTVASRQQEQSRR